MPGSSVGSFEVVYPSVTAVAELPVSVVDKVVDKQGTRKEAEAYLAYLWSDEGQRIAASNYLRPRNPAILAEFADRFPNATFLDVVKTFGAWPVIQRTPLQGGRGVRPDLCPALRRPGITMLAQVQPGRGCLAALSDGGARLVRQALKDEQDRRGWRCPGGEGFLAQSHRRLGQRPGTKARRVGLAPRPTLRLSGAGNRVEPTTFALRMRCSTN